MKQCTALICTFDFTATQLFVTHTFCLNLNLLMSSCNQWVIINLHGHYLVLAQHHMLMELPSLMALDRSPVPGSQQSKSQTWTASCPPPDLLGVKKSINKRTLVISNTNDIINQLNSNYASLTSHIRVIILWTD